MAKKFCLGDNLELAVVLLNRGIFHTVFTRPDKNRIRASLQSEGDPTLDFPDNLESETDRVYGQQKRAYDALIAERERYLSLFGVNVAEIRTEQDVDNLHKVSRGITERHIEECPRCRIGLYEVDNGLLDRMVGRYEEVYFFRGEAFDGEAERVKIDGVNMGMMDFDKCFREGYHEPGLIMPRAK